MINKISHNVCNLTNNNILPLSFIDPDDTGNNDIPPNSMSQQNPSQSPKDSPGALCRPNTEAK